MRDLLAVFPGAQRALFRRYHIGGCSSCGFRPEETLAEVCARNENLAIDEVIDHIHASHEADEKLLVSASDAAAMMREGHARIMDVRTREEWEAAHVEGTTLFNQELMHQLGSWDPAVMIIFMDHKGARSLDAVAYFIGHGVQNVRALRGGIDAWSCEVDPSLPRYDLE